MKNRRLVTNNAIAFARRLMLDQKISRDEAAIFACSRFPMVNHNHIIDGLRKRGL